MIIYPAIDIRNGRCVRLYQGQEDKETVYGNNPVVVAEGWVAKGAQYLHVVDLDGAFSGTAQNRALVREIIEKTGAKVQIGGGIRSRETADEWIRSGAHRIVLGTAAVKNPELLRELAAAHGEQVVVSLDCLQGYVCVDGWVDNSKLEAIAFAKELYGLGIRTVVYTDISRDGTLVGPNIEELDALNKALPIQVVASGGVSSEKDIEALKAIDVYGVIIGKALYEGRVQLENLKEYL